MQYGMSVPEVSLTELVWYQLIVKKGAKPPLKIGSSELKTKCDQINRCWLKTLVMTSMIALIVPNLYETKVTYLSIREGRGFEQTSVDLNIACHWI